MFYMSVESLVHTYLIRHAVLLHDGTNVTLHEYAVPSKFHAFYPSRVHFAFDLVFSQPNFTLFMHRAYAFLSISYFFRSEMKGVRC